MEPSHSTESDSVPRRWRAKRRRVAAVAAAVAIGLLVAPAASRAAPATVGTPGMPAAPQLPADPQAELAELEAKASELSKQYRGDLIKLEDAKKSAEVATSRLKKASGKLEQARQQLARLAASQYMSAGLDPALTPLMNDDPDTVLDRAVTAQHLARTTRERLSELSVLKDREEEARRTAKERLDEVRDEVEDLEKKRHKVQKLIEKFRPQTPLIGGDNVTPRMRQVRDLVLERFSAPYAVGCYRAGSWGEHPVGRACDFMLSSGGAMPSAIQVENGWAIANWATENASRLGIMYVIYRQQIWDLRSGGGWRMMSDRGSITQNHYDHVHISVF